VQDSAKLGLKFGRRIQEAAGGRPVVSYGKACLVGTGGAYATPAAWSFPVNMAGTRPWAACSSSPSSKTRTGGPLRLDDTLGPWFAVVGFRAGPAEHITQAQRGYLTRLGGQRHQGHRLAGQPRPAPGSSPGDAGHRGPRGPPAGLVHRAPGPLRRHPPRPVRCRPRRRDLTRQRRQPAPDPARTKRRRRRFSAGGRAQRRVPMKNRLLPGCRSSAAHRRPPRAVGEPRPCLQMGTERQHPSHPAPVLAGPALSCRILPDQR
jgi:hypothetical protein